MQQPDRTSSFKKAIEKHQYANPFINFLRDYQSMMAGSSLCGVDLTRQCKEIWDHMTPEDKLPYEKGAEKIAQTREKAAKSRALQEAAGSNSNTCDDVVMDGEEGTKFPSYSFPSNPSALLQQPLGSNDGNAQLGPEKQ